MVKPGRSSLWPMTAPTLTEVISFPELVDANGCDYSGHDSSNGQRIYRDTTARPVPWHDNRERRHRVASLRATRYPLNILAYRCLPSLTCYRPHAVLPR